MVHMPKTWYYHGKCKKTAWFSMVHIVKQHCITMVKLAKTSSINVTCYQAIGKSLVCFACSVLVSVSLGYGSQTAITRRAQQESVQTTAFNQSLCAHGVSQTRLE